MEYDQPIYKDPKSIALSELVDALSHLTFFQDAPFLRMQVYNLKEEGYNKLGGHNALKRSKRFCSTSPRLMI